MTLDRLSNSKKSSNSSTNVTKRKRSTKVVSSSNSVFDTVASLEREDEIHLHSRRHRNVNDNDNDLLRMQQRQKAAVQAQTNIYSRLIECRILLQRSMTSIVETPTKPPEPVNEHPRDDGTKGESNNESKRTTDAAIDQCNNILIKLLEARRTLLKPPSKSNNINGDDDDYDDHDDDDDFMDTDDVDYETLVNNSTSESTTNTFDTQLQKEYEGYREQWKEVLNRRHHDVQLHSGLITNHKKFNMIDTSFWNQVQSTIQHQQLRNNNSTNDISALSIHHTNNRYYKPFDDTKIYQQMLKDFVETATASNHNSSSFQTDAALLRKRNQQNQSSSKPMVDRKASKGRKIRYTTITKLTNFTFPIQRRHTTAHHNSTMENDHAAMATFLDEDAWFRSLFGGK